MDYTIGQFAKRSGVTVRTLHHYEKLGLLPPSGRTESGYRRYTERDVLRLHRILAFRHMGVLLKDIAPFLGPNAPPLQNLLAQQTLAIQAEIDRLQRVLSMLSRTAAVAKSEGGQNLSDQLLDLMNSMHSIQQHYTAEELKQLHSLRDAMPSDDRLKAKAELAELLQQFGAAKSRGTKPTDGSLKGIAQRWMELGSLAAPSPQLRAKTRALIDGEPEVQRATGITPGLKSYIDEAIAAIRQVED